jgi:ATP-dependent helicase/nuclease subunit A
MTDPLAYELNGHRITRAEFYAIACDPRRSVAVEACAGAGKTWMLVSRILRALLEGAQPHEVLAITFTKKAAGEMRQRLLEWLEAFSTASPEVLAEALAQRGIGPQAASQLVEPLSKLYQQVLSTGRGVQIRTFHSWFAALLRSAPLATLAQLGLPASHELLEDDGEAIERVWRRFHTAVAARPEARADYEASVAAHGRSQTLKALRVALDKRVEFTLADGAGVVEASVQHWLRVFPDFAPADEPAAVLRTPGAAHETLALAARALGRASQPSFSARGVQLEQGLSDGLLDEVIGALLTKDLEPRKFSDKLAGIDAVREAQDLALRLCQARAQHEAWLHQQRLARLARILIAEFAALKREEGWVDMSDVERAAFTLLSDPVLSGWVQERLDARVRHLLVDEFQDTNPLQWQALHAWLSGYAGAADPPSVFVVGDPKQSIYRFRRAEPQVFAAAQDFVVQGLGGDRLSCDHTHRNAPALVAAVNAVMDAAQADGHYHGFRPHTTESRGAGRLLQLPPIGREAAPAAPATAPADAWRDSLSTPRELPEERLVTLECRQAARWIAARIADGLPPQDLMVLARRRDRLAALEDELRALYIPAQQPEKTDLAEAPEVQDIAALLDVLVSPTHDLSLARALKSPVFGLPDAALVQLALRARQRQAEGTPRPWFELLQKEELPAPVPSGLAATLAKWKGWVDRWPPHDALDAIFHDGDVLARYAQAAPPALRDGILANLRAVLAAALQVDGGRYVTPYALVRALKAGGLRGPAVAQPAAVRLLTVHGAKGLEAPVVLLLDTDGAAPRAESMGVIVEWPGEAPAPSRFAFLASESRPPACSTEALQVEQAARRREELNALYVAMTRARSELVVSSVAPRTPAEGSWWQRLAPHCTPAEVPQRAPVDAGAALAAGIRLPVVPPLSAALPAGPATRQASSDAARFGEALHRLLEHWPAGAADVPARLRVRVGREFSLPADRVDEAVAMARRIVQGEGAWAWDPREVDWQGNEVELLHEGELLRLDRLVRRRDGHWWVLDFKSAAAPQRDAVLVAQMRRYAQAVAALHPGAPVRTAFLTGQGRLVPADG